MGQYKTTAAEGKQFVLTQKGYDATPDHVKPEREVGKPVFWEKPELDFANRVPTSWIEKGWVEEVDIKQ